MAAIAVNGIIIKLKAIFCHNCRSGSVQASELEPDYGEDLDFLMAKLRIAEADTEVSFTVS